MIELKIGNLKIGKDTIIFNMGSAKDCPSDKLGICKISKICYAKKAERQYPSVIPYRERQMKYWLSHNESEIANDISLFLKKRPSIKYFRVNESGDFFTQECVEKLKKVALLIPSIVIYTYTTRKDLNFDNIPTNLVINGSQFMIDNNFQPVKGYTENNKKCAGNCRICNLCKKKEQKCN